MTFDPQELILVIRKDQRRMRREAQKRLLNAVLTGQELDMADFAQSRGLVLRERENSIFSDVWLPLAFLFIILGFIGARHLAILSLGFVLLLIVVVSTAWKKASLVGVTYERTLDRNHAFPGEPIELTITVGNHKRLPLTWLQFRDELPVAPESDNVVSKIATEVSGRYILRHTFSLNAFEETKRRTVLRFPQRGYYDLGPVTYESGDIFTLFTISREHQYLDRLVIYPQIWPLEELGLPAKEPFGEIRVLRSLFTDPIKTQGIRDYQPGDRFRDIHWKATVRRGSLQTKIYDPSTGMTIAVFLNVATFPKHWMGFDPALLERSVSVAASIATYGLQNDWGTGVYANGSVPMSDQPIRVPPSHSPEQLEHVLEALAAVTEFATGSIERLILHESTRLPWAATIVLVSSIVTDEIMVTLLRLKEAGRKVVLVSLASEPPPKDLGIILSYHIPSTLPAFQHGQQNISATEAALSTIPVPDPNRIGLEPVE